jgi:hypothetical protein
MKRGALRLLGGVLLLLFAHGTMAGARIELATHPSGADAWAGDRYLGRTPLSTDVAVGTTLLRLAESSDSLLWTAPAMDTLLHAEEGETLRLELQLGRTFRISSRPAGFPVLQGGRRIGETPLDLRLYREEIGSLGLLTRGGMIPIPAESLSARGRWSWEEGPATRKAAPAWNGSWLQRIGRYATPVVACGLAAGGAAAERAADRSYRQYLSTADPSRIEKYYDEARRRDALSTALWVGAEVSLATMIVAWIFPERPGEGGGR